MERGHVACITGATSGIGAAFAEAYAKQGYHLILTGRREKKLRSFAESLRQKYGVDIKIFILELSKKQDVLLLSKELKNTPVDVFVNNAGFGIVGRFQSQPLEEYLRMIEVHVSSAVALTKAVLPQMIERDYGDIINVASDAAYMIVPRNAVYSGTKAFVKQFTEGLYLDLRSAGSHIRVQALCPGLTKTDFQLKLGMPEEKRKNRGLLRWQEPREVVAQSFRCLEKGRPLCICGGVTGRLEALISALLPKALYYRLVLRLFPG